MLKHSGSTQDPGRLKCYIAPLLARLSLTAMAVLLCAPFTRADDSTQLKVVGGLAGVSQYERLEKPFWEHRIEALSNGRIKAEIRAFDRSGLSGQEMLQLMRLGIVPFGTALLAVVSGDEPELNAADLPGLNPDMQVLRKTVGLYRSHLQQVLRTKFDIELLAIYAYPAQVIFCAKRFTGLSDLAGRRIRTSSVGQSEMMAALGAIPVLTPFSEIVSSVRTGAVDCAITGTLSGNEIGLSEVTAYIAPMAISWGLSLFGANTAAWEALPSDLRLTLREAIGGLETEIWDAADRETADGLACDIGASNCSSGRHPSHMTLVPASLQDEAERKRLLVESVLPGWILRCGAQCAATWNRIMAPALGIEAPIH